MGSDGQGRGRESLGRAAGGGRCAARAAGRGRGGRGCEAQTRRRTGCRARAPARTRSPRAPALGQGGGAPAGRRRALATPTARAPPGRRLQRHKHRRASLDPQRPRLARATKPAAAGRSRLPVFVLFPKPPAARGGGGRAPGGSGVGLREGARALGRLSVLHRGSSGRDRGLLEFPIPRVSGSSGSGSAEISDPLPSES